MEHDHTFKMREKDSTMEDLSHQLQLCKTSLSSLKQEASEVSADTQPHPPWLNQASTGQTEAVTCSRTLWELCEPTEGGGSCVLHEDPQAIWPM